MQVMHHPNISSRSQVNINSNENHYPRDDTEIAADDKLIPAQEKFAYLCITLTGLGFKSAQMRILQCKQTAMH